MGALILYRIFSGEFLEYFETIPIAITLAVFAYFTFLHSTIFGKTKIPFVAIGLEFLMYGAGFAYLRKPVLALISWGIMYFVILKSFQEDMDTLTALGYMLTMLVVPFLTTIFIKEEKRTPMKKQVYPSKPAPKKPTVPAVDREKIAKETLQAKLNASKELLDDGKVFALDTNILMHEADLIIALAKERPLNLIICMEVHHELDGLKKDPNVGRNAQHAFDVIAYLQDRNYINIVENVKGKGKHLQKGDETIIATYCELKATKMSSLIFVSNDKGAGVLARNAKLQVFSVEGVTNKKEF